MFDHVGISVADLDASKAFFETALTPLGIQLLEDNRLSDGGRWRVFGTSGNAAFFVVAGGAASLPTATTSRLAWANKSTSAARRRLFSGLRLDIMQPSGEVV
jgi:catechol 2,3-dioxygenase-like lactoylglutathione lyase family enzyme